MSLSGHLARLRQLVGHAPLLLPSVTLLVLDAQQRVLLVRQAGDQAWLAPGGLIEPGETPADAALREAWEETGLEVELTDLQGVYAGPDFRVVYRNGDVVDYVMIVFTARPRREGDVPHPLDAEIEELRYVAAHELEALPLARWARTVVPAAFAPARGQALRSAWRPPA